MTEQCPGVEALVEIAELPVDDPRRVHLDECPRCRSRLSDYRDFMSCGSEVPAAELDSAMVSLKQALDTEIHPEVTSLRPFLARPAVRGVLALAALLLFVVALNGLREVPLEEKIRLRAPESESALTDLLLLPHEMLSDGGILLSWNTYPEADDYELLIMAPDLGLLATLPCGGETRMSLEDAQLRTLLGGELLFVWRVKALAGGDSIAASEPASCRLPQRP